MNYRAFISYSHKDQAVARWLHRKLESYRLPRLAQSAAASVRHPLRPVFLDREELASAASLSESIVQALDSSAALIVICSPNSVASRWVNEEIHHFRKHFPQRPVFAIVAWGDPGADPRVDPGTAAIPIKLLLADIESPDGSLGEPLAVDIRKEGDGKQAAFLKLVAGLLRIPYSQLRRREQRRRNQVRSVAFIVSLSLTAVFALLAWRATVARNEARAARAQAELELQSERQTRQFLLSVFQLADPGEARGEKVTVREVLDTAVARIDSTEFARPVIKSRFLATMGQAYSSLGMNRKSVEMLRQSLQQLGSDKLNAESWSQRIDSQLELANVLFDMGDYEGALASLDEATATSARDYIEPLQMAYAENIRGDVLSYQGKDETALSAYQSSLDYLDQAKASLEQDVSSRSRSLGGLAVLQHFAGNYEASMKSYAAVVAMLLPVLGERHPDTIWALVSWGSAAYSAGATSVASEAWTQALANAEIVLGENHPEVGTIKNNLGRLFFENGNYDAAEAYLRAGLQIDRAQRSDDFDDLAFTLNNLALTRMAQGDLAEARQLLDEARHIATASQHRILGPVLTTLADIECMAGKAAEGGNLAEQGLEITQEAYGVTDWYNHRAVLTLAYCRHSGGQQVNAAATRKALDAIQQRWPTPNYFIQRALLQAQSLQD